MAKHDNYDTDTSGYGLFLTSIDALSIGNYPASHFLEALCQEDAYVLLLEMTSCGTLGDFWFG